MACVPCNLIGEARRRGLRCPTCQGQSYRPVIRFIGTEQQWLGEWVCTTCRCQWPESTVTAASASKEPS